jgi:hypothetical protein
LYHEGDTSTGLDNLENPVLVVQGHAQLLQGGSVVFDTRLGQQVPEELIGRAAPGAQHFE